MKNIALLEQEINAPIIEYKPFQEYTLGDLNWDEGLHSREINMNPYSMSFFIKSLFCENSSAVFVSSFLNFFQELEISTLERSIPYSISSNAATLYMLKSLETNGVIKIIEYNTDRKNEELNFYQVIKRPGKTKLKKYNVLFYKIRDLNRDDRNAISKIKSALHIKNYQLKSKFIENEMYVRLSRLEVIKCIFTGHIFSQLKKNINYWKKAEGFKDDISAVLYNLTKQGKPTTK